MKGCCGFLLLLLGFLTVSTNGVPTDLKAAAARNDTTSTEDARDIGTSSDDDSDMLMEPDEFSHIDIIRSDGQQIYPTTTEYESAEQSDGPTTNTHAAAQNFYPTFFREAPPLGHSRPYFQAPEGPPSSKIQAPRSFDQSILGSGDFGVIRGGTFYAENEAPFHGDGPNDYGFFFGDDSSNNNGHGRPHADAFIQKFTYPEEQFANFRDFAEINTPSDSAFSQFVVVYANKNSTSKTHHPNPKNIFEQLELLDKEKSQEEKKNRISKAKAKLASTKLERKYKKQSSPKDLDYEPLLALS